MERQARKCRVLCEVNHNHVIHKWRVALKVLNEQRKKTTNERKIKQTGNSTHLLFSHPENEYEACKAKVVKLSPWIFYESVSASVSERVKEAQCTMLGTFHRVNSFYAFFFLFFLLDFPQNSFLSRSLTRMHDRFYFDGCNTNTHTHLHINNVFQDKVDLTESHAYTGAHTHTHMHGNPNTRTMMH